METTVKELTDSRTRVEVKVEPDEVERRIKEAAKRLGGEMKISGFREGKVPPEMVLQRLGRETVLSEALEGSLGDWYERAMLEAQVSPVGDPKLDMQEMPDAGEPLEFAIEVSVLPKAELGEWKGIEVGRAEAQVPAEAVDAELERLREGFARLNPVERAAADGDVLLIDYEGKIDGEPFDGGAAKDYLLEVGAGRVLPEFEAALKGARGGDDVSATVNFPDDYQGEDVAGKTAGFEISVREVREKELPDLDDDFAAEASEFVTLDELREQISAQIEEYLEGQIAEQFRASALDAAAEKATVELPDAVITARASEMWSRVERQLRGRGMDPNTYLQMQGKTREELIAEAKPEAEQALRREAVLAAIAEEEGIEIGEEDMLEALQIPPGHEDHGHPEPAEALAELRGSGHDKLLADDLRMRRALELVAESAKPIPLEASEARESIWTPEKEREQKGGLWTPGSD
ncbi:MAG: trigger factor [Actinobacteria bacterium]|nr:trigger factor [Actinomycetota bacterium]